MIIAGFAITALGLILMLRSQLGMGPWGALEVGLSARSDLTLGHITQLVSLVLILLAWALKIRPTIVTLANMFLIGIFMDLFMKLTPVVSGLLFQLPLYIVGLVVYSFGISFYLIASDGNSGPRESMMLGISKASGTSIRTAKIILDLSALILAIVTGGPIGIGTIVFAFAAGPIIQLFMHIRGFKTIEGKLVKYLEAK